MGKKIIGIRKRGKRTFELRYYDHNGIRQSETIKAATAEEAAKVREVRIGDKARGIAVSSKPNTIKFDALCGDVMNDYIAGGFRSFDSMNARMTKHVLPAFGQRRAASITTADVKQYISKRIKAQAPPGTINRELDAIRRAFNLALEGEKILRMPHVPRLREDNVRTGFFTREEIERLCSFLKEPFASFTMFGFLTGWRYSEIRNLLWRNIDFAAGEIRLDVGSDKNRAGRVFPMTVELLRLLESRTPKSLAKARSSIGAPPANRNDSVNIMVGPQMSTVTSFVFSVNGLRIPSFRRSWKTACFKAGLPCVLSLRGKPIKALRLFHDLRRSAAREMERQGLKQSVIKSLMGHKSDSMFNRYRIVDSQDLREAAAKMDAHASTNLSAKD